MKNRSAFAGAFLILILAVLGCGLVNRVQKTVTGSGESNKTLTDRAVDSTVGEEKIGVPECDEVLELLAAEANNPDDDFVTKAIKATFLNKIRESIRKSVEENKSDKTELAKNCKEFKRELEKFKSEAAEKKKQ